MGPHELTPEFRHKDITSVETFDQSVDRIVCTVAGYGIAHRCGLLHRPLFPMGQIPFHHSQSFSIPSVPWQDSLSRLSSYSATTGDNHTDSSNPEQLRLRWMSSAQSLTRRDPGDAVGPGPAQAGTSRPPASSRAVQRTHLPWRRCCHGVDAPVAGGVSCRHRRGRCPRTIIIARPMAVPSR